MDNQQSGGVGLGGLLFLIFMVLKLAGVVSYSSFVGSDDIASNRLHSVLLHL